MKCKTCNGLGRTKATELVGVDKGLRDAVILCPTCGGIGEVEQTKEEWLEQASTEEKARFLDKICYSAWGDRNSRFKDMADYTDWLEWLKEKQRNE